MFLSALMATASCVWAQSSSVLKLEFDVASVKENKTGDQPQANFPLGPGAMYNPNGGVFAATSMPMWIYIMFAYKMTDHQVEVMRKQLPAWAAEGQFDIQARTDKQDVTKDEMRAMMQALLHDRFKLVVHTATEQTAVYGLVVAKAGRPGLRVHPAGDASCTNSPVAVADKAAKGGTVEGGFPAVCGGAAYVPASMAGRIAMGYRNVPVSLIALQMTALGGLDRPVVDETGMTGNVDFVIEFSPERAGTEVSGPSFREALADQTGLKLVGGKKAVEVILVDHIEYPTAN